MPAYNSVRTPATDMLEQSWITVFVDTRIKITRKEQGVLHGVLAIVMKNVEVTGISRSMILQRNPLQSLNMKFLQVTSDVTLTDPNEYCQQNCLTTTKILVIAVNNSVWPLATNSLEQR
ncbi:uncharacterized protein LOC132750626 [Ruditapes philippinarum]|uniref:uncharacterized protein LOC132750626 n=1 Tax=Ruditapes philippinarum TaxID=129788 RepID=UPI00295AF50B|nr:uncharacterized protein LOC132750626 [Ruditapes philippinarum]